MISGALSPPLSKQRELATPTWKENKEEIIEQGHLKEG